MSEDITEITPEELAERKAAVKHTRACPYCDEPLTVVDLGESPFNIRLTAQVGVQVVALGDGKFDAYVLEGGLPGLGWTREKKREKIHGSREGDTVRLQSPDAKTTAVIRGARMKTAGKAPPASCGRSRATGAAGSKVARTVSEARTGSPGIEKSSRYAKTRSPSSP